MKTLYFECKMGAAGDMLMAALYEICDQKELFLQTMNQAFSEYGIQISAEESKKCGISGTHMHVMINGEEEGVHVHEHVHTHTHDHTEAEHVHTNEHEAAEHHHDESSHAHTHHSYQSVLAQIEHLQLPAQVKADAAAIYRLIGEAESAVHNTTLEQIIFIEHHQQRLAGRIIFYLPPMCRQPMQSRLVGHKYPIASAIGIGQYARRHKRKLHPEQGICHIHPDHRIALSAKSDGKTLRPEQSPVVGIVLANFQFLPVCPES